MRSRTPTLALLIVCLGAPVVGGDLRDPTRPPTAQAARTVHGQVIAEPRVSAIFLSGTRKVAIVNDRLVKVGDILGDFVIDEITSTGVRYRSAGHLKFAALPSTHEALR